MRATRRTAVLAAGAALALAAVGVAAIGGNASAAAKPITIGYAFDSKGQMGPFDGPALAAAKLQIAKINKAGGVNGRKLKITTCDTQNNKPAVAKSCAVKLLTGGAQILFVTCDVDFATPAVQEGIKRGVLTIAPCIGTDQMGPKRFGAKGKLAFSFGNVAQDEGAAMAEFAYKRKGWKTASIATNNLLVYFKDVTKAFEKRFTQLGGKIATRESYTTGNNDVGTAVGRLNGVKADVIVTSTAFGELPGLVAGPADARQQDADPQLVGRRRHVLAAQGPHRRQLLRADLRLDLRRRPEPGRQAAHRRHDGGGRGPGHGRLRDRRGVGGRRRGRDQEGQGLDQRRQARRPDREVQGRRHGVRQGLLLAAAALGVRARLPRDRDPEQQGQVRRDGHGDVARQVLIP